MNNQLFYRKQGGGVYTDTAEKCGRAVYNMEYRSPRIHGGGGGYTAEKFGEQNTIKH